MNAFNKMKNENGFTLSTFVFIMVVTATLVAVAKSHRDSSKVLQAQGEELAQQAKALSSALSRYYRTTCNVGAVTQAVLETGYIPSAYTHSRIKSYSLQIILEAGEPHTEVQFELTNINGINSLTSPLIQQGATLNGDRVTLKTHAYVKTTANALRLRKERKLFTHTAC